MLIQGALFAWIYDRALANRSVGFAANASAYAVLGAAPSWSFTTLAVAAKNVMASVPDYVLIETGRPRGRLIKPATRLADLQAGAYRRPSLSIVIAASRSDAIPARQQLAGFVFPEKSRWEDHGKIADKEAHRFPFTGATTSRPTMATRRNASARV
jgi:hypothetical protein